MILSGAWYFRFRTAHLSALEPLDLRGEACMRLHKLDAELVKTKSLQGLRLLHVSANFVESIRNAVSSGAWRESVSATITVCGRLWYWYLRLVDCGAASIVGVKIDISRAPDLTYNHVLLTSRFVITTCLCLEWITAV